MADDAYNFPAIDFDIDILNRLDLQRRAAHVVVGDVTEGEEGRRKRSRRGEAVHCPYPLTPHFFLLASPLSATLW